MRMISAQMTATGPAAEGGHRGIAVGLVQPGGNAHVDERVAQLQPAAVVLAAPQRLQLRLDVPAHLLGMIGCADAARTRTETISCWEACFSAVSEP